MGALVEGFDTPLSPHEVKKRLCELEQLQYRIDKQDETIEFLTNCVGLLMRAENHRIDRLKMK